MDKLELVEVVVDDNDITVEPKNLELKSADTTLTAYSLGDVNIYEGDNVFVTPSSSYSKHDFKNSVYLNSLKCYKEFKFDSKDDLNVLRYKRDFPELTEKRKVRIIDNYIEKNQKVQLNFNSKDNAIYSNVVALRQDGSTMDVSSDSLKNIKSTTEINDFRIGGCQLPPIDYQFKLDGKKVSELLELGFEKGPQYIGSREIMEQTLAPSSVWFDVIDIPTITGDKNTLYFKLEDGSVQAFDRFALYYFYNNAPKNYTSNWFKATATQISSTQSRYYFTKIVSNKSNMLFIPYTDKDTIDGLSVGVLDTNIKEIEVDASNDYEDNYSRALAGTGYHGVGFNDEKHGNGSDKPDGHITPKLNKANLPIAIANSAVIYGKTFLTPDRFQVYVDSGCTKLYDVNEV